MIPGKVTQKSGCFAPGLQSLPGQSQIAKTWFARMSVAHP
jgi:hypothetical protein